MIFSWREISVPKEYLVEIIDKMDVDQDGNVSIKEVISMMKTWRKEIKKASKFLKE